MKQEGTFGREMVFCDRRVNRVCVLQFLKGPLVPRDRLYIIYIYIYMTTAPDNNLTAFHPLHNYTIICTVYIRVYNMYYCRGTKRKK